MKMGESSLTVLEFFSQGLTRRISLSVVTPWFSIYESYSPAIHNVQNTLMFRLTNPEGELPPVPSSLTRYLDPPRSLIESAVEAKQAAVEAFKILLGESD